MSISGLAVSSSMYTSSCKSCGRYFFLRKGTCFENKSDECEVNIIEEKGLEVHMKNHMNDQGRIFEYNINEKRAKKN